MILIDTGPLVALLDSADQYHQRARSEASKLGNVKVFLLPSVLHEAVNLLAAPFHRQRLHFWTQRPRVNWLPIIEMENRHHEVLRWLTRYAEHTPDWTDACISIVSERMPLLQVWTFDREFRTIWRRLDGSKIPLTS